jgi:hypothetical protein
MTVQFNKKILYSQPKLEKYFSGEKENKEIRALAKTESNKTDHYYFGRWEVTKTILGLPFTTIQICALGVMWLGTCLVSRDLKRRCELLLDHRLYNTTLHVFDQFRYGKDLIGICKNVHSKATSKFFATPPIPFKKAYEKNPELKKLRVNGSEKKYKEIKFYHGNGICHGMVTWALYHCLLAQKKEIEKPVAFMRAIVKKLFADGASKQAVLAHNFDALPKVDIKLSKYVSFKPKKKDEKQIKSKCLKKLDKLSPGTYTFSLGSKDSGHAMLYYKHSDKLGILVDPNGFALACREKTGHSEKIYNALKSQGWMKCHKKGYFHINKAKLIE